jgi:hypothetical protein
MTFGSGGATMLGDDHYLFDKADNAGFGSQ